MRYDILAIMAFGIITLSPSEAHAQDGSTKNGVREIVKLKRDSTGMVKVSTNSNVNAMACDADSMTQAAALCESAAISWYSECLRSCSGSPGWVLECTYSCDANKDAIASDCYNTWYFQHCVA